MKGIAPTLISLVLVALVAGCQSNPDYQLSDHYNGEEFHNIVRDERGFWAFIKWQFTREPGPWPPEQPTWTPVKDRIAPQFDGLRVVFVNHATFLVQRGNCNILVDPVWSDHIGPTSWLGVNRRRAPGFPLTALPSLDAILVSHNHYDHLDLPTLAAIAERQQPPIWSPLGNNTYIDDSGLTQRHELDWWQSTQVCGDITITLTPARHWSKRTLTDRNEALWGGFHIATPQGSLYYAGDTGWTHHFEQIAKRLGAPDLALLPIGAYKPRWFMQAAHINPTEAIEALKVMNARQGMALHFGTFPLGDDGMEDPLNDSQERLRELELPASYFVLPNNGDDLKIRYGLN